MSKIFLISDHFNGFFPIFLDILVIISFLAAVLTIISKNPIVSVLHLILLFSSISLYLIFIGIKFVGISYLLVYVGAVSILFLFILMLINVRISELTSDTYNYIPLAVLTMLAFFIPLSEVLPDKKIKDEQGLQIASNTEQIKYVSSNNWDNCVVDVSDIISIGNVMYTSHSIWLLITSIILLLAMVGSIAITIKQKY